MTETATRPYDDEAAELLDHYKAGIKLASELPMTADPRKVVTLYAPRFVAALEALLQAHSVVQLYETADGCEHPEPAADTDEHDEWAGDHPHGTTGERICILSPFDRACVMCSEMTYGEEPTTDDYVGANCHVRVAILGALEARTLPARNGHDPGGTGHDGT